MHHNLEILSSDPLKLKMDYPILIVSMCMGKSIKMKRVKELFVAVVEQRASDIENNWVAPVETLLLIACSPIMS